MRDLRRTQRRDRSPSGDRNRFMAEESPMTNLARQLMGVHINEMNAAGNLVRRTSPTGSEDSLYFSARSTQSICSEDTVSLSPPEESTLRASSATTPYLSFDKSRQVSQPGRCSKELASRSCRESLDHRGIPNNADTDLDQSLLRKIDSLFVNACGTRDPKSLDSSELSDSRVVEKLDMLVQSKPAVLTVGSGIQGLHEETKTVEQSEGISDAGHGCVADVHQVLEKEPVREEQLMQLVAQLDCGMERQIKYLHREQEKSNIRLRIGRTRNDKLQSELYEIETSYGQLHDRYETLRASQEETLQLSEKWRVVCEDRDKQLEFEKCKYEELRTRCEDKLADLIAKMDFSKQEHEVKMKALNTTLRKAKLTIEELNRALEMKNQQIERLNKLCDEAIHIRK